MKRTAIKLILNLLFLSCFYPSSGQKQPYRFEFITKEDGLSSNYIHCIFQDSFGFMWFGTNTGLNRYDGTTIVSYSYHPEDSLSVSNNDITCIVEEPGTKNLWIGTYGGLNYFDRANNQFQRFLADTSENSVSSNYIYDLAYTDSTLWIGTTEHLDSYKDGKFDHYKLPPLQNKPTQAYNNYVASIYVADNGMLWLGTVESLCTFDLTNLTLTQKKFHDELQYITEIDKDSKGNLWFNSKYNGPFVLENGKKEVKKLSEITGNNDFVNSQGIIEDDNDKILIANRNIGLNVFDFSDSSIYLLEHDPYNSESISGEALLCMYKSKDDIIWIGSYNSGINYYDKRKKDFGHYKFNFKPNGLINDNMRSVFQDSDGIIWFGTKENGCLSKFNKKQGTFTHYLPNENDPNALHGDYLFCIDEYDAENLLIGTLYNGINIFNKKTGTVKHLKHDRDIPNALGAQAIYDFKRTSPTEIIVATHEGIEIWNTENNSFKHIDFFRNARCFYIENENRIWVGTLHEGIYVFDAEYNLIESYKHAAKDTTSLGSNSISAIKKGPDNKIWICTGGGGLNYYIPESNSFGAIKEKDGLANNHVCEILFHNPNEYWLSTANGLSVYNPKNNSFKNYDKTDGLQGNEFADYVALKLRSGELIFGGLNGFNMFKPEEILDNTLIPEIVFTDLRINNKPAEIGEEHPLKKSIELTDEIVLTHQHHVFSIGFAALNYSTPEKNQYQYKLEGFDNEWLTIKDRPNVTYTNLPPAQYVFKVKASNNDGYWNEVGSQILITVLPAWWETIWFQVTAFVLTCLLISAFILTRFLRLRRNKEELEYLVDKGTRELKEAQAQLVHSEKMASLGVLTAGVAHEINNPLNFIQSGIYSVESVLSNDDDFEEKQTKLKMILQSMQIGVERTSTIIKSLNSFSRKSTKDNGECDLHEIIDNCLTILNHEIIDKCKVVKNYCAEPYSIIGSRENLHQVFLNIIKNAFQAIESEGVIEISTQLLKKQSKVEIVISDNGVGISSAHLEKIHDPFFTTKEAGEGVGLGLFIVFKIISEHNGRIKYESELNKGTAVKITLPIQT